MTWYFSNLDWDTWIRCDYNIKDNCVVHRRSPVCDDRGCLRHPRKHKALICRKYVRIDVIVFFIDHAEIRRALSAALFSIGAQTSRERGGRERTRESEKGRERERDGARRDRARGPVGWFASETTRGKERGGGETRGGEGKGEKKEKQRQIVSLK